MNNLPKVSLIGYHYWLAHMLSIMTNVCNKFVVILPGWQIFIMMDFFFYVGKNGTLLSIGWYHYSCRIMQYQLRSSSQQKLQFYFRKNRHFWHFFRIPEKTPKNTYYSGILNLMSVDVDKLNENTNVIINDEPQSCTLVFIGKLRHRYQSLF